MVQAPDNLRELLEAHLELRRYREVTDLDDAEIARLVVLAEKDARELGDTVVTRDHGMASRRGVVGAGA